MYRNFSKIISGIVNDIGDWVTSTRIKSAALLYQLLLNEEDNMTQHLQKVLTALYKACGDEEPKVVEYVSIVHRISLVCVMGSMKYVNIFLDEIDQ